MLRFGRFALLLVMAGLLVGCGGGGGSAGGGDDKAAPTVPEELDPSDALDEEFGSYEGSQAYIEAGFTCGSAGIEELARQYKVKPTIEAVARAVGNEKDTPKEREEGYKGCLDTLKAR